MLKTNPDRPDLSSRLLVDSASLTNPSQPNLLLNRCVQAFLLAWLLSSVLNGLAATYWFSGYPVNGPFQLYDPLRRIAAGQRAGQDFQFFHGIGIPFLHYPLFWLFGAHSLQASELSRQWTSLALFTLSLAAFIRAAFRSSAEGLIRSPWVLAAIVILLLEITFPHSAEPGHSLISGRSAMPVLAFAVLLTKWRPNWKGLTFGVCIGGALAFGTEHGLSLILALGSITTLLILQGSLRRRWAVVRGHVRFLLLSLSMAALTAAALFISFAGWRGARGALHYNLSELPADQFWFFGSPPMPYLTSLSQLLTDRHAFACFLPSFFLLATIGALLLYERRVHKRGAELVDAHPGSSWYTLSLLMLSYALLTATPLIGILSRHYVFPQTRIFLLWVVVLLSRAWTMRSGAGTARVVRYRRGLTIAFATLCVLLTIGLVFRSAGTATRLLEHDRQVARFDPALDSYWDNFMADATATIDQHRTQPTLKLWSEYAALLDASYGTSQPAEDYIIHAVGAERWAHYLRTFRETDPEFVTTMTSQFSFAEWLQDERWDFYQQLVDNYRPLRTIAHATIWQRLPGAWKDPPATWTDLPIDASRASITLPASPQPGAIVIVQLHYRITNPWKKLPLIGATPRYVCRVTGTDRKMAISLPPYMDTFRFPVKLSSTGPVRVQFAAESFLPGARLLVSGADSQTLPSNLATAVLFTPRQIPSRY